ncbi:hypothetical protein V8F20_002226 [Naviculisporaceae sp. PSN 640]
MPPSPSPPLNNPAILVAYATSTGTTREIAERIASTLQTTTSWRVDCKPVNEIRSLHKELHCRSGSASKSQPVQPPAPAAIPNGTGTGTGTPPVEDHTIHANPLSALISNEPTPPEPEPEPVEYRAIVIGSSIHAGRWLSSGRGFIHRNRDFFAGRCCNPSTAPQKPAKGKSGWATLWGMSIAQAAAEQQHSQPNPNPNPEPEPETEEVPLVRIIPKIYAFSVGMPPTPTALHSEEKTVEAALRKSLGKLPSPGATAHGVEEDEILQRHVLFRGMWSPKQLEMLAPRFVTKVLRWCIPKDSEFMREDDERDWKVIEGWAVKVGKDIMGEAAA